MQIGVLGTGVVGRTIAGRLVQSGHQVALGTRDPQATLARADTGRVIADLLAANPGLELRTFAEAAASGEVVVNATSGQATPGVLSAAGVDNLAGKVLIDISNALDHSGGFPPSLSVVNTDSVAEQIQRAYPQTLVVKALNVVNAEIMVHPDRVGDGDHTMFVAGNDPGAKETVKRLLAEFGWRDVIDIGDVTAARGMEMYLPLWLRLMGALGTAAFNVKVVR